MKNSSSSVSVELARHLGLFDATMIGVGAMIGAGIFVLTGIAMGLSGPAALVAFGLNGLVTLFTALSYAELASVFPQSGGGYTYIKKVMPNSIAFMAGWMLWFAYTVACSLYAKGFGSYFFELAEQYFSGVTGRLVGFLGHEMIVALLTISVGLFFLSINIIGTFATGKTEDIITLIKVVILGVFIYFGVKQVWTAPEVARGNFEPLFPKGWQGVFAAMGLTFIAFEGYDLIATLGEEIKEPRRTIPRAILLSLGITVIIYLLVIFVCLGAVAPAEGMPTWQFLGKYQETGIVKAAQSFMPAFGMVLIIWGGLFSTMSALNATVMASSRVAFSMGRDRMLPDSLGRLHPVRRTPILSLFVTGALFLGIAVFLPLKTIGTATSLLFLITFGFTNMALIMYRQRSTGKLPSFRVPLYPLTPLLGVLTCAGLALFQLFNEWLAWVVAAGWIAIGLGIYAVMFARKVSIADVVETIRQPELLALKRARTYKVLAPLANPLRVKPLIRLAAKVARASQGEVIALSVVKLPGVTSYSEAGPFMEEARSVLTQAQEVALALDLPITSLLTVTRDVSSEIVRVAKENNCSLILLGYKKATDPLENSLIHHVILHQPCDVAILKTNEDWEGVFQKVLLPVGGKDTHDRLKVRLVRSLSQDTPCEVTLLNVIPHGSRNSRRRLAKNLLTRVAAVYGIENTQLVVEESEETIEAIVSYAADQDLLVLGMRAEPWFRSFLFGTISQQVASQVQCPTLLTKTRAEGRSFLKRLFGVEVKNEQRSGE